MKKIIFAAVISAFAILGCSSNQENKQSQPIKIACIGNSITEGYGHQMQSKTSWPVVLNSLLGKSYSVVNCGRSATTLQKNGDYSYWTVCDFSNALLLQPDITIIKMGTNDTKPHNWNQQRFKDDYQSMIDTLLSVKKDMRIILCKPVPAFDTIWGINDSTIVNGVIPVVEQLAEKYNFEVIDFHILMQNDSADFLDKIHPNEKAAAKMAKIVYDKIKE